MDLTLKILKLKQIEYKKKFKKIEKILLERHKQTNFNIEF